MAQQRQVRARSWQVTLILTLFFIAVAGAAGIGWWYARESPPHQGPIVLITVDGLPAAGVAAKPAIITSRPDAVALAEPSALAALAEDAVIFDRAYTHSAQLLPAQASLLSGRLPFEHGVRDDAGFVLRPDTLTLPELLHNRGFKTGAAVSTFLLRETTGIARGFSTYTTSEADDTDVGRTTPVPAPPPAAGSLPADDVRVARSSVQDPDSGQTAESAAAAGDRSIEAAAAWATRQDGHRYFLMLEQGKLVSPGASKTMREIFQSPDIPHDNIKFVQGLAGRDVQIIRKWGTWEDWRHDSAVVTGGGRHYILVALTKHPKGDEYLVELAKAVDDFMVGTDE